MFPFHSNILYFLLHTNKMQRFLEPKEYLSFSLVFGEEKCRQEETIDFGEYNFGMVTFEKKEKFSMIQYTKHGPFCVIENEQNSYVAKLWESETTGSFYNGELHGPRKNIDKFSFLTGKRETVEVLCVFVRGKEISREEQKSLGINILKNAEIFGT
ncbi:hypothetical protein [Brazilian marseillevirus]|uniref:hypothetical protein n=1 Tax=Brazilian marseillevirus TaxID=1813599 RepID=UPI0007838992|nr:hypothetical protein A3303_gp222 [Brazilian marseillevirus]AMQ10730.1 hypothetical protein [Brazilian marseillevirus]